MLMENKLASYLNGTVVGNQFVLHVIAPQTEFSQVLQKMLVHYLQPAQQNNSSGLIIINNNNNEEKYASIGSQYQYQ